MPRKTFKLQTTSEELIAQINPENKKLVSRFLREKNTRSSDSTIKGYESDLNIFLVWNLQYNNNKYFVDIKKLEFSEFFSFGVSEMHWSSARFGRVKSVLSSLSNFIERFMDDLYPNFKNVILKAVESMPKNTVREKTILTDEQVENLLNYFKDKDKQLCCWLALSIASGSRFSELLRFTIDNIDENHTAFDGLFLETLKPIKSKGRTKTGKMLIKYILKDFFLPYYNSWLEERQEIINKNNKIHNFVFIKDNGDPAKESTARSWVMKIEEQLNGVPYYPHCNRHYYTTMLSKKKIPSELIQELVGWSSEGMVKLYTDTTVKDRSWDELDNLKT
jgi:site-specific recombinase XerD